MHCECIFIGSFSVGTQFRKGSTIILLIVARHINDFLEKRTFISKNSPCASEVYADIFYLLLQTI